MRKQGVIAAFFPLEAIEWVPRELLQSQTDAELTRSQEVSLNLALAVQSWDPIQNALKIVS
jgi:hypothetical protein